jgi:hypothetical protein
MHRTRGGGNTVEFHQLNKCDARTKREVDVKSATGVVGGFGRRNTPSNRPYLNREHRLHSGNITCGGHRK